MKRINLSLGVLVTLGGLMSGAAQAEAVIRVVIVETDDVAAYALEIDQGRKILKRLGSESEVRVLQATYAGPTTGTVVVTVEYADMAAMAADDAKTTASSEYQDWLAGLDDLRRIVSDSLYREL